MDELTKKVGEEVTKRIKKYMEGDHYTFDLNYSLTTSYLIYKFLETKEDEISRKTYLAKKDNGLSEMKDIEEQ